MGTACVTAPSITITVLIVDDNADHRLLMQHALRDGPFEVRLAGTAEEALDHLEGVDLVLLDQSLPGMTGIDALREVVSAGTASVVMVTGIGNETLIVEAMQAGALDYLVKRPGYLENLPEVIRRAYSQHDLRMRANALQRLALLVTSTTSRDSMFDEIVLGARHLLAADACVLAVLGDTGLGLPARSGDVALGDDELLRAATDVLIDRAAVGLVAGTPVDRLLVPLPSVDGDPLGVLMVLTERPRTYQRAELELAEAFAAFAGTGLQNLSRFELERRLITELQQAADARRDFIGAVSHELRTPLTCIVGFSETLARQWAELDGDTRSDFLLRIRDNADSLNRLVEQLLEVAAAERGEFQVRAGEPFDLVATTRDIVERLRPQLGDHPVELQDTGEVIVRGDPMLIRRAMGNLLSNASKYSPPGRPIRVSVRSASDSGLVEISDEGPGLSADEARRAFEPFWRAAHTVTADNRGTGLGLALARQYIEGMGGHVGVDSEPGAGATFWISLPKVDAVRPVVRSDGADGSPTGRRTES